MDSTELPNTVIENTVIEAASNSTQKRIKKRSSKAAEKQSHDAVLDDNHVSKRLKKMKKVITNKKKTVEEMPASEAEQGQNSYQSDKDLSLLENLEPPSNKISERPRSRNGCSPTNQIMTSGNSKAANKIRGSKKSKKKMSEKVENMEKNHDSPSNNSDDKGKRKRSTIKRKSKGSVGNSEKTENRGKTQSSATLCEENRDEQDNLQSSIKKNRNSKKKSPNVSQKAANTIKNTGDANNSERDNSRRSPSPNFVANTHTSPTNIDDKNVTRRKMNKKSPKRSANNTTFKIINTAQDNSNLLQDFNEIETTQTTEKSAVSKRKSASENPTTILEEPSVKERIKKKRISRSSLAQKHSRNSSGAQLEPNSAQEANLNPPGTSMETADELGNMEMTKTPRTSKQLRNLKQKNRKVFNSSKNSKQKISPAQKKKQISSRGSLAHINKRNIKMNSKLVKAGEKKRKIIRKQAKKKINAKVKAKTELKKKMVKKNKAKKKSDNRNKAGKIKANKSYNRNKAGKIKAGIKRKIAKK